MRPLAVSAVVSALALAACAPTDTGGQTEPVTGRAYSGPAQPRQCFSVQQVSNYTRGNSDQVFLRVGRSDVYELSATGGCPDIDFAQQMALIPDAGMAGSRICTNDWARVVVPGSSSRVTTCRVRVSRQLTEAEVAALPSRQRP
ncbi:DUF6491 family protein [Brevundimonas sp. Root1423]|uniref:DUF6491 family protein n=1 Tax=Brevundimonas sp. Root1423 TaxID=1736462 RepID=UPI0007015B10|nr:DUF6491 family protein [Brevundimonas sp. Root1423]KQY89844.1 hypothetical protein ASD25_04755 [Brevundimonas sp. Root1423]